MNKTTEAWIFAGAVLAFVGGLSYKYRTFRNVVLFISGLGLFFYLGFLALMAYFFSESLLMWACIAAMVIMLSTVWLLGVRESREDN